MNNIKKLYLNYTFNRANIIIILLSLMIVGVILNLYDFSIPEIDYSMDQIFYHNDYLIFALQYAMPVAIVVLITIIIIDNISNSKRFDILFTTKVSSKKILKIKIMVYLGLAFYYISALYIMIMLVGLSRFTYFRFNYKLFQLYIMMVLISFEAVLMSLLFIRVSGLAYSAILVFIIYFMSRIFFDMNKILGSILFLNPDINGKIAPISIAGSILVVVAYAEILIRMYGKKELKLDR